MEIPRPAIAHEDEQESPSAAGLRDGGGTPAPSPSSGSATARARATPHWLLVAQLIRPHGRRGELIADILTDFPNRFQQRPRLFLIPPERLKTAPREVQVENFWFLRSRIVLKFAGVDSINEAEGLRGFGVAIPASERAPAEEGSAYISDLIGCRVTDANRGGAIIGEIVDVDRHSSSTDLLVVRRQGVANSQREALIPFVRDFLLRLDTIGRIVEMKLPEGLLEINAPLTDEEKSRATEAEQS